MNFGRDDQHEDFLTSLMARYDEMLAGDTPRVDLDESALDSDAALAAAWVEAKSCLELLDRARRDGLDPGDGDSRSTPQDDPQGSRLRAAPEQLGPYRVVREIGRGGLGIVYLAHDSRLNRDVALKIPRSDVVASDSLRRRFLREAEAAARLNHPHVVALHDVGQDGALCYLASEYCDGPTLAQWLRSRTGSVPIREAAAVVLALAEAVEHAHSRGVLHRDIKPGNVILGDMAEGVESGLAAEGLQRSPKLTDFGMAKLVEQSGGETRTGAIIGTLAYMSPEQAEGRLDVLDARTDVYGLGAILYELLTGRPPYVGRTDAETLRQLIASEPIAPGSARADVPRDLEAITLKCLARRGADRYATAHELAVDLRRFLSGEPTVARPLRAWERTWKCARRRPWTAAIVAVISLLASALLGTIIAYNAQLRLAIDRTDRARDAAERAATERGQMLYAADVRLAYETLKANNVVQALEVLDRQIPQPGETDLREFSWYYLRRRCEPDTLTLAGHTGTVFSVAFSPDGRRLATASQDGTARIWNAATGDPLKVLRGHTDEVTSARFAPDGRTLATASEDCTIRIWNVETGETIRVLEGHADHVQAITISPNGQLLASGGRDATVRIWDAATGAVQATLDDSMDVIRAVAFSPSGDKLFAVDERECLHVWQTAGWRRIAREVVDRDKLFALAVSQSGTLVAAGGRHEKINLWKVTGDELSFLDTLARGHTEWIQSLAFSPVDDVLASGGKDGVIRLWKPGETTPRRTLLGHKGRVWSVAWSPDGKRLASAGANAAIKLWDLNENQIGRYPPLPVAITCIALAPDGSVLLSGTTDGFVQVWNPVERTLIKTFRAHSQSVSNLCLAPGGPLIASAASGESVKVWSRSPITEILSIDAADTARVAWAPRGHRLAIATGDMTAAIVDVDSGSVIHRFEHDTIVRKMAFTPDGRRLVTAKAGSLDIWDFNTERRVFTFPKSHYEVAVASDGGAVAAITGSSVSLIDLSAGFRRSTLVTIGGDAKCATFSPDGNTLAVALLRPAVISLWDRRTQHELMRLECDAAQISGLAFSPDGRRLLVGGTDTDGKGGIWEWTIRKNPR